MKKKFLSGLLALAMAASLSAFPMMAEAAESEYAITDSTAVRLLGRGEESDGKRTFNWSNAGFEFSFSGTTASVNVAEVIGTSYFNVQVDGKEPQRVLINKTGWVNICSSLGSGSHTVRFVRSSSGQRGAVKFDKIKTDAAPSATEEKERRIEFIGDSYTTGYGNIHTDETWEAPTATDSWYSYAGYAARELDADYTLIAYAGRGVVKGYDPTEGSPFEMPCQFELKEIYQNWDSSGNMSTGEAQDFSEYDPQLVVIWLGTNDQATGVSAADFEVGYTGLLERVRDVYPKASILCLSKVNEGYPANIKNAIAALGGEDAGLYYRALKTFSATSMGHPSKAEAEVMGKELAKYIKELNVLPGIEDIGGEEPNPTQEPEEEIDPSGYRLLYENTFDNGRGDLPGNGVIEDTENFTLNFSGEKAGIRTVTFDGNNGIAANTGAWPAEHTFLFDFTKDGTKNGVSSGIYKFSFDFSTANDGGDNMYFIVNAVPTFWEGGRFATITKDKGFSVFNYVSAWGPDDPNKIWPKNDNEKYHCDMILNFDKKVIHTYVDGTFLGETVNLSTMNNLAINMAAQCDYFDNLKLEYYDSIPMNMKVTSASEREIVLDFTDGIADKGVFDNGITIKNVYTGEEIAATVSGGDKAISVIPEKYLSAGYEYTITLPDGIVGREGTALENNFVKFNFAQYGAIKSLKLRDISGEIIDFGEENPAEISSIVFEFTDDVSAERALGTLTITDKDENDVNFIVTSDGSTGEAVLTDAFKGSSEYKLTLKNLAVSYEIKLATQEGKIASAPIKMYKPDGVTEITSLDDISVGDTVKAVYETVNTSEEEINCLCVIAMYNGKLMTGINLQKQTVVPGSRSKSEFEFTVKDTADLSLAATVWDGEKVWPLTGEVLLGVN